MWWIIFSLLAALIWAVVNTIDKYVIDKIVKNPVMYVIFFGVVSLVVGLLAALFHTLAPLSWTLLGITLLTGVIYFFANLFFFKAVKIEEITRVIPLFQLAPLFILIFAGIFLGEVFTLITYVGIFLLIAGAVLISSRSLRISWSKAAGFMVLAALCLATTQLLTKYLLGFVDYWTIFSYTRLGTGIVVVPFILVNKSEVIQVVKESGKKALSFVSCNEGLNLLAILFLTIATSTGYVTLTNALVATRSLFVFVIVIGLSLLYPRLLREELTRRTILQKSCAILMMIIGVVMIS